MYPGIAVFLWRKGTGVFPVGGINTLVRILSNKFCAWSILQHLAHRFMVGSHGSGPCSICGRSVAWLQLIWSNDWTKPVMSGLVWRIWFMAHDVDMSREALPCVFWHGQPQWSQISDHLRPSQISGYLSTSSLPLWSCPTPCNLTRTWSSLLWHTMGFQDRHAMMACPC